MNIYIFIFMVVWVWALLSDIATYRLMREYNNSFIVALRGSRVELNTRGKIIKDFVRIGFFVIVAYWFYYWFIV